jgi:hypothetical protein
MLRKAGQLLERDGYDFIFTGEVLGQRPMSQNANSLKLVAKASGYGHLVLRPLSARCLPPTAMEEKGLVPREQLGAISGRGRVAQMELARELRVSQFPAPGGGCLLTDPGFSRRLRDLLKHHPECAEVEVELLKHGRVFRLAPRAGLVVGRNHEDNCQLAALAERAAGQGWLSLRLASGPSPLAIYQGSEEHLPLAAALLAAYAPGAASGLSAIREVKAGPSLLKVTPLSKRQAQDYLL